MTEAAAIETPVEAPKAPPPANDGAPAARVSHGDRMAAIFAADASTGAPAADDTPPADDAKPVPAKDPKADPSAARFAALARENEKAVRAKQDVDSKSALVAERETKIAAHEATLKERETKIAAAESRGLDLLEGNPAAIFDRLMALGVDTPEKFQQLAQGKWKRPVAEVKPDDPNRPLTIKEFEERQKHVQATEAEARAAAEFVKLSSDEAKFEASNLLYSDAERVSHAQRIASGLIRAGKAVPPLADLALAVEALAQRDARWQKIMKRSAKTAEAGSTAGNPATTAPASIARAAPGPKTPSNDSATETTPKLPPPTGSRKQQRAERLRRMFHPEG